MEIELRGTQGLAKLHQHDGIRENKYLNFSILPYSDFPLQPPSD